MCVFFYPSFFFKYTQSGIFHKGIFGRLPQIVRYRKCVNNCAAFACANSVLCYAHCAARVPRACGECFVILLGKMPGDGGGFLHYK